MSTGLPGAIGGRADDLARFELGVNAGQYPQPANARTDGATVTTGTSPWLGIRCRTCNQTFRRGDQVRMSPTQGIQHLDPTLQCAPPGPASVCDGSGADSGSSAVAPASSDAELFTSGLLDSWPPLNDAPVVRLTDRHWQVTRPTSGPASVVCPGCGHTFRVGDMVIICPCAESPDDERRAICGLPVHRDPAAGLACWDYWRPDGRLIRCPRTHKKLVD